MYEPIKYPCWRFHRELPMTLCQNPEEEAALGEGWADTPAAFDAQEDGDPSAEEPASGDEPKKPRKGKK